MNPCRCTETHDGRRIVLTGGPAAGKSAVLELARLLFCSHVLTLPEAAGIVFGGRFPRNHRMDIRRAAQRAIYHVQRELESTAELENAAVVLCDRGTPDGSAYWVGEGDLWSAVGTTRDAELQRYYGVILLRTPSSPDVYDQRNPLRIETQDEARAIDAKIAEAWSGHPRLFEIPATEDFLTKAAHALHHLHELMPECCRSVVRPFRWPG
jgi:predicted ATPase